jgi:uncharacterized membrane protein
VLAAEIPYNKHARALRRRNLALPHKKHRRWTVIMSGLLIGALTLIVMFTSRAALVSPAALVVVAAVGVMALMLQLRLRYPQNARDFHLRSWLNLIGGILALIALFRDWLHIRVGIAELVALAAIGCFGVSGTLVLHNLRKRRSANQSGN